MPEEGNAQLLVLGGAALDLFRNSCLDAAIAKALTATISFRFDDTTKIPHC